MLILLTNDDGVQAEGILALKQAVDPLGEVIVVAPDRPRSASGHSITLHKPLRIHRAQLADGSPAYATTGTPSDCVTLALLDVLKDRRPDVVISGINAGPNLGWDLTYSGTVSAAMEGAIAGLPSFAISVVARGDHYQPEGLDYGPAARMAAFMTRLLQEHPLPHHTLLNINVPPGPLRGVTVTRQGVRTYPGRIEKRLDPSGRAYYWLGGDIPEDRLEEGTDVKAVADGYVSVTPIQLDLTDYPVLQEVARKWDFTGVGGTHQPEERHHAAHGSSTVDLTPGDAPVAE
jgi:5'-nucleotidase